MKIGTRISSYDFFRGVLLSAMIFAHILYSFYPINHKLDIFFLWVPAGFVLFSGLISGEILLNRKNNEYFLTRGIQIFLIFLILNIKNIISSSYSILEIIKKLLIGDQLFFSFEILLPISLTMFFIPLFKKIPSSIGFIWFFLGILLLDILMNTGSFFSYNLHFFFIGGLGFFLGKESSLESFRKEICEKIYWAPPFLLFFFLSILSFIGIYQHSEFFFNIFHSWIFQIILVFLLFFNIPNFFNTPPNVERPWARNFFETLGVSSLFLYIFHIAILRITMSLFPNLFLENIWSCVFFALHVIVLSFATIKILQQVFKKTPFLEKFFRFLF